MRTRHTAEPLRSPHWTLGWVAGAGVVAVAAGLLVTLIRQARQIAGQAREITSGLQRTAEASEALWTVQSINATLKRIVKTVQAPPANTDEKVRQ